MSSWNSVLSIYAAEAQAVGDNNAFRQKWHPNLIMQARIYG